MRTTQDPRLSRVGSRGFTLIELLTVMAIISILLSVAAVGISRIEKGTSISSALALSEALFSEARSTAIGEGTRTRVVIHSDSTDQEDPERYLRYLGVAIEEKDDEGNGTGNWKMSSRGSILPAGVYFDRVASQKLSSKVESDNPSNNPNVTGFGEWDQDSISFPGKPGDSQQSCYFYEFNSEGICVMEQSTEPGAAFVVSTGNRPRDQEPILDDKRKAGFVIWRSGNTSLYKNSTDLKSN